LRAKAASFRGTVCSGVYYRELFAAIINRIIRVRRSLCRRCRRCV